MSATRAGCAQTGAIEDALQDIFARHPELRGATVYPMARGETMVRVVTARGWTPVLVRAAERTDAAAIEQRLESALQGKVGICRTPCGRPPGECQ
ncbi:MAG: hypothetical protein ABW221_12995 [Vicinamibacteria bacterium]